MIPSAFENRIVVRGAGEMASGVINRLALAGFGVIALERPNPTCVRRRVCYAEAYYTGEVTVGGITTELVNSPEEALAVTGNRRAALLIDPAGESLPALSPAAVVDGRMLKRSISGPLNSAPFVIGLGPGFVAGENCRAVVETSRESGPGKVIYEGPTQAYTGVPGKVNGFSRERVLRSPGDGEFTAFCEITDLVTNGQAIGGVDGIPVVSELDGVVRGLIRSGLQVSVGQKLGDIDPRRSRDVCHRISDKARAIGAGALEALTTLGVSVVRGRTGAEHAGRDQ